MQIRSKFAAVKTDRLVQLEWAAVSGRLYQLENSTNLVHWTSLTGWLRASASPMTYSGTNTVSGSQYFRVQVRS